MDALPELRLIRPTTLDEAIAARARHPESRLLGGGTDLVVNIRRGIVASPVLIEVNQIHELRTIKADAHTLEIGAAVTLAELAAHAQVRAHYPVVAQAADFIAGPTHRNMGTVGGNLCLDSTTKANGGAPPIIIASRRQAKFAMLRRRAVVSASRASAAISRRRC